MLCTFAIPVWTKAECCKIHAAPRAPAAFLHAVRYVPELHTRFWAQILRRTAGPAPWILHLGSEFLIVSPGAASQQGMVSDVRVARKARHKGWKNQVSDPTFFESPRLRRMHPALVCSISFTARRNLGLYRRPNQVITHFPSLLSQDLRLR